MPRFPDLSFTNILDIRRQLEDFYRNKRIDSKPASLALKEIMLFDKIYPQTGDYKRKVAGLINNDRFAFFKETVPAKRRWNASH